MKIRIYIDKSYNTRLVLGKCPVILNGRADVEALRNACDKFLNPIDKWVILTHRNAIETEFFTQEEKR